MTDWFSGTYAEARARILAETKKAGDWLHKQYSHPRAGPDGDLIATDVFWRGPRDAAKVLVLCSGTHGVEGFAGSAIQSRFAKEAPPLPNDTAVLLVHAVNPYGFAHLRRVNEDNIDLNRNFVDFTNGPPTNIGYRAIDDTVNPSEWGNETGPAIGGFVAKMMGEMSYFDFLKTISGGQYEFAQGIQFGGAEPAWSRRTIETIWDEYLSDAELIVQFDIHTGLGPNGVGALMMAANDEEPHKAITADWFGQMMVTPRPADESATVLGGYMNAALEKAMDALTIPMTLEYGTLEPLPVLLTLIEDNWLANHGEVDSENGQAVRQRVLRAFYPEDTEWRNKVLKRADEVIEQALEGMRTLNLEQETKA